eukprot:scaffold23797_cov118-Isochrysis_galbana.AAC.3
MVAWRHRVVCHSRTVGTDDEPTSTPCMEGARFRGVLAAGERDWRRINDKGRRRPPSPSAQLGVPMGAGVQHRRAIHSGWRAAEARLGLGGAAGGGDTASAVCCLSFFLACLD